VTFLLTHWRWVAAALGAIALCLLFLSFQSVKAENERLASDLATARATAETLRIGLMAQYAELQARGRELDEARVHAEERRNEYEGIKGADPDACAWGSASLPDSVVDFLRKCD
jgi:hypothetical protein